MAIIYNITKDITYKNERDVLNLHFVSHFVGKKKLNYETQKLCFAIGVNCADEVIIEEYNDLILNYADTYNISSFFEEDEQTKKKKFIVPATFNIPRNVLNSQIEKDEIRYYYIMALIKSEKRLLSNMEMQSIWEDSSSVINKQAEEAFYNLVTLGAQYFSKTFFKTESYDITNTFIHLNNLDSDLDIEIIEPEIEAKKIRDYDREIDVIDMNIENLKNQLAQLENQKSQIEIEKYKV